LLEPSQQAAEVQKSRDWDRVIEITTSAIAAGNIRNELVVYQLRANAYVRKYRYDEALSDANHVINFQPLQNIRVAQALNVRGVVHTAQGRYDDAITDHSLGIAELTRVNGRSMIPCYYYDRAMAHARKGDEQRAAEDVAAGLAILGETPMTTPESARAKGLYCLGVAKLKLGDQSGRADIEAATAENANIILDMQQLHGVAGF
jgi:tetratricopeptide (TPR) repeat protein